MKFSELSYREYVTLEILPVLVNAQRRAQEAETKFKVLQSIHLNMGEDFTARVALTAVWIALGVDNQTEAMQKIERLQKK